MPRLLERIPDGIRIIRRFSDRRDMRCTGHVFNERPKVARSHIGHYSVPPRGSVISRQVHGQSFAISPDGFEWVLLCDVPVWTPTGRWFWWTDQLRTDIYYRSVENTRNFKFGVDVT